MRRRLTAHSFCIVGNEAKGNRYTTTMGECAPAGCSPLVTIEQAHRFDKAAMPELSAITRRAHLAS